MKTFNVLSSIFYQFRSCLVSGYKPCGRHSEDEKRFSDFGIFFFARYDQIGLLIKYGGSERDSVRSVQMFYPAVQNGRPR